jgi:hypothetical protein
MRDQECIPEQEIFAYHTTVTSQWHEASQDQKPFYNVVRLLHYERRYDGSAAITNTHTLLIIITLQQLINSRFFNAARPRGWLLFSYLE